METAQYLNYLGDSILQLVAALLVINYVIYMLYIMLDIYYIYYIGSVRYKLKTFLLVVN